jgi:gliding motility-associated-like protein
MKHLLRASFLLLTAWCLALAGVQQAYASHAQGGQLTYEALGNNRYRVTLRYFRDCSGITAETSHTLNARVGSPSTSCNSNDPRNFTTTLVRGQLTSGSPYCANLASANVCSSTSQYANYETAKYTADITLPAAAEWTLSVEISARPSIENIGGNTTLRFEATLNNQIALPNGTQQNIQNTSPQYQDQDTPIPFVCWNQRTTLTFSTFEPDGDSLVYSLDRPLEGCNDFSTYQPISGGTRIIPHPTIQGCYIDLGATASTYSPTFPIFSYTATGACPVQTGTSTFNFNPQLGSVSFTPALYVQNSAPSLGRNKYAVVGKVTEYRLLNGRYYKVGSVRRDMLVVIIDCGGNNVPNAPTATTVVAGSNTVVVNTDSTIIEAQACEYTEVDVNFRDPNPGDQLTVTYTLPTDPQYVDLYYDALNPNIGPFSMASNGVVAPVAKVRLRPDPSLVGKVFRIPVKVVDNACPVRAEQNRIIVVKIIRRSVADVTIAGLSPAPGTRFKRDSLITVGDNVSLTARANRPTVIGTSPIQYTYTWRASTPPEISGLDGSQVNQPTISVTPKKNTRYFVSIAPSGFRAGVCIDTASFAIRLAPKVPNVFTPNGDGLNDFFVIKEASQSARRLEIYNRWGRKIGDWADYKNNWDGKGQSDGVYYYQITLADGSKQKGWVEIVR